MVQVQLCKVAIMMIRRRRRWRSTEDSIICNSKKTEPNLPTLFYPCLNIFAQKDNYKEDYYDSKVELQGPKQSVTVFHGLAISA